MPILKELVIIDTDGKEYRFQAPTVPVPVPEPVPNPTVKPFRVGATYYDTLQAAHDASPPGATVVVAPGTWTVCGCWVTKRLTIVGAGDGRDTAQPTIVKESTIQGKAVLIADAPLTVMDMRFEGVTVADLNGAPVRQQAGNVTMIRCTILGCDEGFLGDGNRAIVFQDTLIVGAGRDGYQHGIYAGRGGSLTVTGGEIRDTQAGGHHIKSRALSTTVKGTVLGRADFGGNESRAIDVPNGGHLFVDGATIYKGLESGHHAVIGYGHEGAHHPEGSINIRNTRFVSQDPEAVLVENAPGVLTTVFDNCDFDGVWKWKASGPLRWTNCRANGKPITDYPEAQAPLPEPVPPQPEPVPEPPPPTPEPAPSPAPTGSLLLATVQACAPGEIRTVPMKNLLGNVALAPQARAVVYAWCGGALVRKDGRSRLYLHGGGHDDYGGAEVYCADLDEGVFTRETNPTEYTLKDVAHGTDAVAKNANEPVAVHTYQGFVPLPDGRIWRGGGSIYRSGNFTSWQGIYDPATKSWTRLPDLPYGGAVSAVYDREFDVILACWYNELFVIEWRTGKVLRRSGPSWGMRDCPIAFDTKRRHLITMIDPPALPGRGLIWELSRQDPRQGVGGAGETVLYNGSKVRTSVPYYWKAGIVYHPGTDLYVCYDGSQTLTFIEPPVEPRDPSKSYREHYLMTYTLSGSVPLTRDKTAGLYNRLAYMEDLDAFVAYNDPEGVPVVFRLPPRSAIKPL